MYTQGGIGMRKRLLVALLSVAVIFTFMPAMAYAGSWGGSAGSYVYYDDDGNPTTGWFKYDGNYYYGDPAKGGQLVLGWKKIGGYWYYFAPEDSWPGGEWYDEGRMYDSGPMEVNGKWYYFARSDNAAKWGKMQTGWVKEPWSYTAEDGSKWYGTYWYYADPAKDSQLAKGWKKIGGKWYYFIYDPENEWYCEMAANFTQEIGGKLYAFNRDGSLHETAGWVNLYDEWTDKNGKTVKESCWVYTDSKGIAVTGWRKISGSWYHFDEGGYMTANDWAEDSKGWMWLGSDGKPVYNKWIKDGTEWLYFKANGYRAENEWVKIGGEWYFFDGGGWMVHDNFAQDSKGWMWMGADGKAVKNKWLMIEGEWCYFKANGYQAMNEWAKDSKGWMWMNEGGTPAADQFVDDNGYYYYIKPDGYMATSSMWIGDKYYNIASNGRILNWD